MTRHCGALALCLSFMAGCAAYRVSPEDPETSIPDRSSEVAVGRMDRASVRGVLGAPLFSSAYWGFDLFRADTDQTAVVYAVTPLPVPFARIKDQLQRFTLVAYDGDDRASAVASGLFRAPAEWRNVSPIRLDYPALHLRAGDLMFFVDPEGARKANLLASPSRRDDFLRLARSSHGCTAVLGCGDLGCGDQLSVDAGPARRLPLRTAHAYWFGKGERESWLRGAEPHGTNVGTPWLEALVAVRLAAGEHVLEFSAKHLGGKFSLTLACEPGKVTYLLIRAISNESFWKPALVDWQIERSDQMPERFARRALVLLDDGQWQVDADPRE